MTDDATPNKLYEIYKQLLDRVAAIATGSDSKNYTLKRPSFSYNLALTDRAMVICPRISEGLKFKDSDGDVVGPISLNGTILGGTLLVKTEQEWDALRKDEKKLRDILQAIGVPPVTNAEIGQL